MRATAFKIRQKLFNKKYCNVGMTQQWPLARNQTYDVGLATGQQRKEIRCRNGKT